MTGSFVEISTDFESVIIPSSQFSCWFTQTDINFSFFEISIEFSKRIYYFNKKLPLGIPGYEIPFVWQWRATRFEDFGESTSSPYNIHDLLKFNEFEKTVILTEGVHFAIIMPRSGII